MSVVKIRAALSTALNSMSPALATAWENGAFKATPGTAFQEVNMLFAAPVNDEMSSRHQEIGYMQVKLMYPLQAGTNAAETRAELIRTTFKRGYTFTYSGVTALITDTPEISPGSVEGDRYALPVKIKFTAQIL